MKKIDRKKIGKRNRINGANFERKVRTDLESKGWIVAKWTNNVNLYPCKSCKNKTKRNCKDCVITKQGLNKPYLIPAKRKYNPFNKALSIGTGFPDFIAYRFIKEEREVLSSKGKFTAFSTKETESISRIKILYEIIGVECKTNGYLDKEEKEKCKWLLENNIFSKILIVSKQKEGRKVIIKYEEFR